MATPQENPVVFISYSWDDEPHKEWVLNLANRLRENGIDARIDRYYLHSGTAFMSIIEKSLADAHKVIIVFTPNYKLKAENSKGGVGHEYSIIKAELYNSQVNTNRFIPVLRRGTNEDSIPSFMQQLLYSDFTLDTDFDARFSELLDAILELPPEIMPTLGKLPERHVQKIRQHQGDVATTHNDSVVKPIVSNKKVAQPALGKLPESYVQVKAQIKDKEKSTTATVNTAPDSRSVPSQRERPAKLEDVKQNAGRRGIDAVLSAAPPGKRNTLSVVIAMSVLVIVILLFSYIYSISSGRVNSPIDSVDAVKSPETSDSPIVIQPDFIQAAILNPAKEDNPETRKHADDEYSKKNYDSAAVKYLRYESFLTPLEQALLGYLYNMGLGVKQDYAAAMKWYRKAADEGNADAMSNIGALYANKQGVQQDYPEALKWYQKAANGGNTGAMTSIGVLYELGQGVRKDSSEAVRWYQMAADKGEPSAMFNIALCYEYEKGVTKDLSKAIKWYQKAADKGQKDAIAALKRLKEKN